MLRFVAFRRRGTCHYHRETHHRHAEGWDLIGEGGAEAAGEQDSVLAVGVRIRVGVSEL